MRLLFAVIGTAGLVSLASVLLILARLTQKWEVVTKIKSYYRLFYVAAALVGLASISRVLRISYLDSGVGPGFLLEPNSWFYLLLYHLPLAIGMTLSLGVIWKSWGWLLGES
ncbi:MAG: hypothetical protein JW934_07275 [Anaerolineae bacterium]|nr:hypothetical protein [Anaerolineae bacterium]